MGTYKYLGVVSYRGFNWKENTKNIIKKPHSRLQCLRTLRSVDVRPDVLQMFFCSTVVSILFAGEVPAGSPSRGGDVKVCVLDKNQPSLPTPFYSVLVSISLLWPFHLYFIP